MMLDSRRSAALDLVQFRERRIPPMKRISREEVMSRLAQHQAAGHNVDPRLPMEVQRPTGSLYLLRIEDEDAFLSLIWLDINEVALLSRGRPRTVRDVARRVLRDFGSFAALAKPLGRPTIGHSPNWFEHCVKIDEAFDFAMLGLLAVVPANDHEQRQSQDGSLYIFDGMHRALVLGKKLLAKEIAFQPFDVLLLIPRRE